ncbi:prepilin-type N-terminal cleavage/methylation domain-containing protein [Microcella daejeonensis]|uniref:type IV pilus modification PilV family protein n=1 Tax=Microcella daejeonensis TaxID=2994971 RepID=UPI00226DD599|nr:prepilin-type N-terminal cleavage/methylation domain-containing protein [Microcella daejeonensis]WAB84824.1 prepilin-type N-terminal cleavage/methylation domain-containing protein [Microcella daejeonensis]
MITAIRRRLTIAAQDDQGMSLPEVLVAMVIFAIISTGLLYTMLSVLALGRDSRARQVALNLAAEEIDVSRGFADVFALQDATRSLDLNGDTFTVERTTRWVSDPEIDLQCGSGGAPLRYKRVEVEVSWSNMRDTGATVRTYTVIDPKNRINDPTKGTILVSVLGGAGAGSAGVTVTATPASPANGATTLAEAPLPTDAQGCTYILKVTPGNYNVSVSRSGYVDVAQNATSTITVGVTAGAAASVGFQYDRAATFTARYAPSVTGPAPIIPNNMVTTFLSSYGAHQSTATNANMTRAIALHPFAAGYEAVAGAYAAPNEANQGCLAPDPAAWPTTEQAGVTYVGRRAPAAAAVPGGATTIDVPMGTFQLTVSSSNRWVRAISVNTGPGPGCAIGMEYRWNELPMGTSRLALPFGTWEIRTGNSTNNRNNVPILGAIQAEGTSLIAAALGRVTLDPRVPE